MEGAAPGRRSRVLLAWLVVVIVVVTTVAGSRAQSVGIVSALVRPLCPVAVVGRGASGVIGVFVVPKILAILKSPH